MRPTWVLSAPDGPHVGPMNLAIGDVIVGAKPLSKPMLDYCQLGNKLQWNLNQNIKLFIDENASENIVCQIVGHFVQGGDELINSLWVTVFRLYQHRRATKTIFDGPDNQVRQGSYQNRTLWYLRRARTQVQLTQWRLCTSMSTFVLTTIPLDLLTVLEQV